MSAVLRLILILASVITMGVALRKIRKAKMSINDAVFWVVFGLMLIILAVFPQVVYRLADLIGIQSPANLLFLVIIFLLIIKVFSMSVSISRLEEKLTDLASQKALDSFDRDAAADRGSGSQKDR